MKKYILLLTLFTYNTSLQGSYVVFGDEDTVKKHQTSLYKL